MSERASPANEKADAAPTKQFFVATLTRDIDLSDALLDLLDNCLDGAARQNRAKPAADGTEPFSGRHAKLTLSSEEFRIEDNCGGIPRDLAVKFAFRMGRPPKEVAAQDEDIETVGMYGIGMKRAIFKMGEAAEVHSRHRDDRFTVSIPPDWLSESDDWSFPVRDEDGPLEHDGTRIVVRGLNAQVSNDFGDPAWIAGLRNRVAEYYSRIIRKGFEVTINSDEPILPARPRILYSEANMRPYVFMHRIRDVDVFFAVGINSPAGGEDTDPEHPASATRTARDGGWTVFCNDRAIVVRDKTTLTGWGAGLPLFHPQFSVIAGLVEFRGKNSEHLPVTTTKRGLDAQSEVWAITRRMMIEATRKFTSYTTWWKNEERGEQDKFLKDAEALDIDALKAKAEVLEMSDMTRGQLKGARRFDPDLKRFKPASKKTTKRRIVFSREKTEIRRLAEELFGDPDTPPGEVGERCFQNVLEEVE